MFATDMQETRTNEMTIPGFSSCWVEEFVSFLYTERIQEKISAQEKNGALRALYDVPNLKLICGKLILRNIDEANGYEVFSLGHLHSSWYMKRKAYTELRK